MFDKVMVHINDKIAAYEQTIWGEKTLEDVIRKYIFKPNTYGVKQKLREDVIGYCRSHNVVTKDNTIVLYIDGTKYPIYYG